MPSISSPSRPTSQSSSIRRNKVTTHTWPYLDYTPSSIIDKLLIRSAPRDNLSRDILVDPRHSLHFLPLRVWSSEMMHMQEISILLITPRLGSLWSLTRFAAVPELPSANMYYVLYYHASHASLPLLAYSHKPFHAVPYGTRPMSSKCCMAWQTFYCGVIRVPHCIHWPNPQSPAWNSTAVSSNS